MLVDKIDPKKVCQKFQFCFAFYTDSFEKSYQGYDMETEESKGGCKICKIVLKLIEKEVKGKNEKEIEKLVHGVCKNIPKLIRHECDKFVHKYDDRVIEMLVNKLDPKKVCHKLKICSYAVTQDIFIISEVPIQLDTSKGGCKICKIVMKEIEEDMKDKNEDEIKNLVHGICKNIPKLVRHKCDKFVDKYANRVINMLVNKLDPEQVCHKLKLCDVAASDVNADTYELSDVSTQVVNFKGACEICKIVMKEIDKDIKDKNEAEIKNLVHGACKNVPRLFRHECYKFVDKYADRVIDMLVNKIGPEYVCHKLKLCDVSAIGVIEDIFILSEVPLQLDTSKGGCKICKIVMKEIEKDIKNKNEDEIKNLVHGICKNIPKLVRHECNKFVDKYANRVIDMLVNKLDPEQVCHKLKLCDVAAVDVIEDTYELSDVTTQAVISKGGCKVCKIVMKEIEKDIKDKNEEEIKNLVHGICKNVPRLVRHECDKFVDKYADRVIDMLLNKLNPEEVCHKLKLCQIASMDISEAIDKL
ncbi:prosaposin-like [Aphomia sociella]